MIVSRIYRTRFTDDIRVCDDHDWVMEQSSDKQARSSVQHDDAKLFVETQIDVPAGWLSLVQELLSAAARMPDIRDGVVKVRRIYESDGEMKIYLDYPSGQTSCDDIKGLVYIQTQFAEASFRTCQVCGNQGRRYFGEKSWVIRCDEHVTAGELDITALFESIPTDGIFTKKAVRKIYPFLPAMDFKDGWLPLFDRLMQLLIKYGLDPTKDKVLNAKEKFAALNVYADIDDEDIRRFKLLNFLIDEARNISSTTCEDCGVPGKLWVKGGGWWLVACADHKPSDAVSIVDYYRRRESGS